MRKVCTTSESDTGNNWTVTAIDPKEIAAINVVDAFKPGCIIVLKSGATINMAMWDGEQREKDIRRLIAAMEA